MKTNPDPGDEDPLLEAVLRDDDWCSAHAAGKAAALAVFQARQRNRRVARWVGGVAALAVLALCAAHWRISPVTEAPRRLAMIPRESPPPAPEKTKYLTDDQLLALFPRGSCFLAEVDGKKKLVFLDKEVERQYVFDPTGQHSFAP